MIFPHARNIRKSHKRRASFEQQTAQSVRYFVRAAQPVNIFRALFPVHLHTPIISSSRQTHKRSELSTRTATKNHCVRRQFAYAGPESRHSLRIIATYQDFCSINYFQLLSILFDNQFIANTPKRHFRISAVRNECRTGTYPKKSRTRSYKRQQDRHINRRQSADRRHKSRRRILIEHTTSPYKA